MFSFFKKKKEVKYNFQNIRVDMHSHILPGIDDGAKNVNESIELVKKLQSLGFEKLIATPHIMADYYRNTLETILNALNELKNGLEKENITIPIEAAAEYYFDETFEKKVSNKELLTFGNNYVLFELSFVNYPTGLKDIIMRLNDNGYQPILAHPERYNYLHHSIELYEQIKEYGCYFQLNTIATTGYYGKNVQKIAEKLLEFNMINFLGSDTHHLKHANALEESLKLNVIENLISKETLLNQNL